MADSMKGFEEALRIWAERKLLEDVGLRGDDAIVTEVVIEADPGNGRDDSFAETPSTNIVVRGRVAGFWTEVRVTPDLLTIVQELASIGRGE